MQTYGSICGGKDIANENNVQHNRDDSDHILIITIDGDLGFIGSQSGTATRV
jgi:hypothetical protein